LAEILPLKKHPVSGKTSVELLAACSDLGKVVVWKKE
jgi:hypothetical protein